MRQLLQDFLEFYRNSLLIGFFKRRGKSLIIPQLTFCIERILENNPTKSEIRILDLGCGEGHLLRVLNQVGKISGFSKKLKLYGLDNDEEMLRAAVTQNNIEAEFIKFDLRHDSLTKFYGFFDIVVAVNTLHEVYSTYVGENDEFPTTKIEYAKVKIKELIGEIAKTLTNQGSFVLYDGLAAKYERWEEEIDFEIKNPVLARYFDKAVTDFTLWHIKYRKMKSGYRMKYRDFSWFVTTFKYLNTKLWPFESAQTYQYFSKSEFATAFHGAGLMRESIIYLSNDLGLWKNNIKIVSKKLDFPPKAIMVVGSKQYIPSQYDYFAAI